MDAYFERVPHTADLAIIVRGAELPDLFRNAARALFTLLAEPPADQSIRRPILVESVDRDALLVDWLNELILHHEVDGETYTDFRIEVLTGETLRAVALGGATVRRIKNIKAATFHDLSITRTPDGWQAHLVFDV